VIYTTSQTLLCETCIALGEHLTTLMNSPKQEKSKPEKATNSSTSVSKLDRSQRDHSSTTTVMSFASTTRDSRVALKRDALNAFADACGYAANAESYELAMHAARHYWNLCMPYLSNSEQRSTLFENLQEILQALQVVFILFWVYSRVLHKKNLWHWLGVGGYGENLENANNIFC